MLKAFGIICKEESYTPGPADGIREIIRVNNTQQRPQDTTLGDPRYYRK